MLATLPIDHSSNQVVQCRRLAHVLTLTQQMLLHAEAGDWELVTERELERRKDLAACFDDPAPAADAELIAEAMAALLHLNEELMAKLAQARTELMNEGREHARKRDAVGSYEAVDAAR